MRWASLVRKLRKLPRMRGPCGPSHLAAGRRDKRQALRVVRCRQRCGSSSRGQRQCSIANAHPLGADNAASAQWDQRTRTGNIGAHTPKEACRVALSSAALQGRPCATARGGARRDFDADRRSGDKPVSGRRAGARARPVSQQQGQDLGGLAQPWPRFGGSPDRRASQRPDGVRDRAHGAPPMAAGAGARRCRPARLRCFNRRTPVRPSLALARQRLARVGPNAGRRLGRGSDRALPVTPDQGRVVQNGRGDHPH